MSDTALPPIVDAETWQRELDELRVREKAATRELDAIAAQRRRALAVAPCLTTPWRARKGKVRLADVFDGKSQLIVYNHMWFDGEEWQCPGCTGFTSQFTRLEFLTGYDARFVIVTQGPIDEALAYTGSGVGNKMTWDSTANSPFGADVGARRPGAGFGVNVFLRDGDTVYRRDPPDTNGRGCEQLSHIGLIDLLPYGLTGTVAGLACLAGRSHPPTAAPKTSPRPTARTPEGPRARPGVRARRSSEPADADAAASSSPSELGRGG